MADMVIITTTTTTTTIATTISSGSDSGSKIIWCVKPLPRGAKCGKIMATLQGRADLLQHMDTAIWQVKRLSFPTPTMQRRNSAADNCQPGRCSSHSPMVSHLHVIDVQVLRHLPRDVATKHQRVVPVLVTRRSRAREPVREQHHCENPLA